MVDAVLKTKFTNSHVFSAQYNSQRAGYTPLLHFGSPKSKLKEPTARITKHTIITDTQYQSPPLRSHKTKHSTIRTSCPDHDTALPFATSGHHSTQQLTA